MNVLAVPLTHTINASIMAGEVPEIWKEAIVVPILKKGDSTDVRNGAKLWNNLVSFTRLSCACGRVFHHVLEL